MTLCIASRIGRTIEFVSDSRLTFKSSFNTQYCDIGIKVVKIPISIKDVENNTVYSHDIGLCFAGHTNAIYNVKDSIYEQLINLKYANGWTNLRFENIVEVIKKVFKHCAQKIINVLINEGNLSIIVGGNCPVENKIKIYLLSIKTPFDFDDIQIEMTEILQDDGHVYIGSGSNSAKDLLKQNPNRKGIYVLKEIIDNNLEPTVGGAIQFGEFINGNFHIKGIVEQDDENQIFNYKLRGMDMYNNEWNEKDFIVEYPYKLLKK